MKHLSLFTGGGGGELGAILNNWETIGYVEWNDYCQRIIRARIEDGILPNAPIFGDIKTFISEGYAESYKGMVDVISGGFPCQPFSTAGQRIGEDDPRNMWGQTIKCVNIIKPRYCFFENVRGLLSSGTDCDDTEWSMGETPADFISYFGTILSDLSDSGYDARWKVISAAEVGAPHKRDRVWIVANPKQGSSSMHYGTLGGTQTKIPKRGEQLSARTKTRDSTWWLSQPSICRVDDGVAYKLDRTEAIGNGQVPAVVKAAWEILSFSLQGKSDK